MKSIAMIAALGVFTVAGCGVGSNRISYDGQFFRTSVKAVDKNRDTFVVKVRDPSKSLLGARQAAHQEGTEYCLRTFGSSAITWDIDPLDEEAQPRIVDGAMTFQGTCPQAQRI